MLLVGLIGCSESQTDDPVPTKIEIRERQWLSDIRAGMVNRSPDRVFKLEALSTVLLELEAKGALEPSIKYWDYKAKLETVEDQNSPCGYTDLMIFVELSSPEEVTKWAIFPQHACESGENSQ